jgi:HEAT repeat protein
MKEQAIFVLSQKKDAGAIDKLIDIAKNDRDREMRGKAIFWLGQSRDPRAMRLLEEIISK